MSENLRPRIGNFFLLAGLIFLLIFIGSILGNDGAGIYLLLSACSFFLGFGLRRNTVRPVSGRFSTLHKARAQARERNEKKQLKKVNK